MVVAVVPAQKFLEVPASVRAQGGVRLVIGPTGQGSAALTIAESGGYRVRFPRSGEGVLINTGGGMVGGDRMCIEASVLAGAGAVLTSQAAEKIYRSEGPAAEIAVMLVVENDARLAWLPQEQIVFDQANFQRSLDVTMAVDASLTMVETIVFGRFAKGESFENGSLRDRWRIRRGGRLVFAEDVRLESRPRETLARRAVAAGGRAIATFLHITPDAESRRDDTRHMLADASCEWGVSAWDGMLIARFLSSDPQALRTELAQFLNRFRGEPLPRSWQT